MTFDALPRPSSGAMTAAMRAFVPAVLELRVALVRDGRIVDEHRVARRGEVTVGGGERSTLVTSGPRRTLFATHAQGETGFALVGGGVSGRVQQAGRTTDLATLADGTLLPLVPGARGRVAVDGGVVLFDFVPARARLRAALPAAVRKGLLGDVDWSFTAWVTAAMLACFGLVAMSEASDPAIANDVDATLTAVAHMVIEPPDPPPPAALATRADAPSTSAPSAPHATPGPTQGETHRPSRSATHEPAPTLDRQQLADDAATSARILLATALGGTQSGFDAMRGGAPTTSQAEIMAQVSSATVATNGAQGFHTRAGDSSGESHDLGTLARHGVTAQADEGRAPTTEVVLHTVVRIDPPGPPEPGVPQGLSERVARAVRARVPTIRACYEHHLIHAPDAAGKVVESFTVEPFGGVSHLEADSNTADDETARCVHDGLATMRVQVEEGEGPADFQFPFVFAPQN